jgi:hypothetical protein
VGPALDTSIHNHINSISHGIDNFRQLIEGCSRAVQLAAAMVG